MGVHKEMARLQGTILLGPLSVSQLAQSHPFCPRRLGRVGRAEQGVRFFPHQLLAFTKSQKLPLVVLLALRLRGKVGTFRGGPRGFGCGQPSPAWEG